MPDTVRRQIPRKALRMAVRKPFDKAVFRGYHIIGTQKRSKQLLGYIR